MNIKAVILSAGESSRFRPLSDDHHKSLIKIAGKELIRHTIESALKGGVSQIVLVHGPKEEKMFKEALKDLGKKVIYVLQPEPKGMGNALKHAKRHIDGPFMVLNADRFDAGKYIKTMLAKAVKTKAQMVLLCAPTDKPSKFGIAEFDKKAKDKIIGIVEKPKAGTEKSNQKLVGIYYLPKNFMEYYSRVEERQYSFEDALDLCAKEGMVRAVFIDETPSSAKYAYDLLGAAKIMLAEQKRKIAKSAQIAKSAIIEGAVHIGENTKIFEHAVIKGPAYIGANCIIGNNALIRGSSILEDNTQAGMNTEIKSSILLEGAHIHSGFIGDSVIGKNSSLGANFVTANRRIDRANVKFMIKGELVDSGLTFLGCVLGHNVKAGINASTMPGAIVGSNSIIGSGTEVKGTIESNRKIITKREIFIENND